ncbi:MAG: hypothetical protein M3290_11395 [Actinomycetota bacterium]|nr:hypothetical protein [Actinomycetota bacterium]
MMSAPSAAGFQSLVRDPLLTVACVLLLVVCIGWIVATRLITHNLKRAARRAQRRRRTGPPPPPRDIWSAPP